MRRRVLLTSLIGTALSVSTAAQEDQGTDGRSSNLRLLHEIEVPGWSPGGDLPVRLLEDQGVFLRQVAPHTIELRGLETGLLAGRVQTELDVRDFGLSVQGHSVLIFGFDAYCMSFETWGLRPGGAVNWGYYRLKGASPIGHSRFGIVARSHDHKLSMFVQPRPTREIRPIDPEGSPNWPDDLPDPGRQELRHLTVSNDGSRVAWLDDLGNLAVLDVKTSSVIERRRDVEAAALKLDDDGNLHVISGGETIEAYGRSARVGRAERRVSFSPDGRRCAIDLSGQRLLLSAEGLLREPLPDARHRTLLGDKDHELRIWSDRVEWNRTRLDPEQLSVPTPFEDVVVSGDGQTLAAKVWRRDEIHVFDLPSGRRITESPIPCRQLLATSRSGGRGTGASIDLFDPDSRHRVLLRAEAVEGERELTITPPAEWPASDQPQRDWPRSTLRSWAGSRVGDTTVVDAIFDPTDDVVVATTGGSTWDGPRQLDVHRIPVGEGESEVFKRWASDQGRMARRPGTDEIWCFSQGRFARLTDAGLDRRGVLASVDRSGWGHRQDRCLGFMDRDRLVIRTPKGIQIVDVTADRQSSSGSRSQLGRVLETVDLGAPAIAMSVDASGTRLVIATPQKLFVYEVLPG